MYFTGLGPVKDGTPMNLYVLSGAEGLRLPLRGAGAGGGGALTFGARWSARAAGGGGRPTLDGFGGALREALRRAGAFLRTARGFFALALRFAGRALGLSLNFFLSFRLERLNRTALFDRALARPAAFFRAFFVERFFFFSALRAGMT